MFFYFVVGLINICCVHLRYYDVFSRNPPAMTRSPNSQNATMTKDACSAGNIYWPRVRVHDKTGLKIVFFVCSAGTLIGCVVDVNVSR